MARFAIHSYCLILIDTTTNRQKYISRLASSSALDLHGGVLGSAMTGGWCLRTLHHGATRTSNGGPLMNERTSSYISSTMKEVGGSADVVFFLLHIFQDSKAAWSSLPTRVDIIGRVQSAKTTIRTIAYTSHRPPSSFPRPAPARDWARAYRYFAE